jgi:hypothetical protein
MRRFDSFFQMQIAARIDDPMFRNYAETPGGGGCAEIMRKHPRG